MLHLLPELFGLGHNHGHSHEHDHDHHKHNHEKHDQINVPNHVILSCVLIASLYSAWIFNIIVSRLTGGHCHVGQIIRIDFVSNFILFIFFISLRVMLFKMIIRI
jgi:hypothetical protein